ncbi:hypothetical protein COY90_02925 [Candidatus Roizmanbacteria bacterium CG_4_10_14_0_8_um_filter_39_9]|uniref:Uncharacterized protein n=1 Tax=Candidatus Roizmanbacteria bacterium CG_4_10_14_0_8_um_filter_39_9 TaxID=1974829 RepID=A0A2M7QCR8_9BACT|nr:MAG: hypothetical protein COY90_02925 [Candidatus Roizmanbacteria bacterium CG_4_10_14_0_8_um_filter_39_9]
MKKIVPKLKKIRLTHLFKIGHLSREIIFAILCCCFIGLTILLIPIGIRFDFSRNQAYSLSGATKKIIQKLDKPVSLTFYVTSELPTRLIPLKTEVIDLLNEYKKINNSKIAVTVVDPKKDPKKEAEIKQLGLPELQFSQLEQDKYQVTNAYFGLGITYQDKKEIIPQLTDVSNIEYNITSLIYRMTKKEFEKIGIIGVPQSADPQNDSYYAFKTVLFQQYEIAPLTIETTEETPIDKNNKLLIIIDDSATTYDEVQLSKLKKYAEDGGKIIFFIDGVKVNESLQTSSSSANLSGLLRDFGIHLEPNLVLSSSAEYVNFGNSVFQYLTPYPFWVKSTDFNTKTGYFANISQLTFPWTSSVTPIKVPGVATEVLAATSKQSWEQRGTFELNPQNIPQPLTKNVKSFALVAQSAIGKKGTVVVVPTSRFVDGKYLSRTSGNIEFAFNMIDNLASSGALSGIRSRATTFQPLPELPQSQKELFKYVNILLLPGLLALYGTIRIMKRK